MCAREISGLLSNFEFSEIISPSSTIPEDIYDYIKSLETQAYNLLNKSEFDMTRGIYKIIYEYLLNN